MFSDVFTWSSPENAVFLPNKTTKHHRFPWSPLPSRTAGMTAPLATQNNGQASGLMRCLGPASSECLAKKATARQTNTLGPRHTVSTCVTSQLSNTKKPTHWRHGPVSKTHCLNMCHITIIKHKETHALKTWVWIRTFDACKMGFDWIWTQNHLKNPQFVAAFNRFPHRQGLTGAPRKWPWEVHRAHSWHSVTGTACATSRCWTTTSLTARGPLGSLVMPRANGAETIYCQLKWTNVYHISRERHCGFFIA